MCLAREPRSGCQDVTNKKRVGITDNMKGLGRNPWGKGDTVKLFSDDMRGVYLTARVIIYICNLYNRGNNTVDDWPGWGSEPFRRRHIRFRSTGYRRDQKSLIKQRKRLRITERSLKLYTKGNRRRTVPAETRINRVCEEGRRIFPELEWASSR